MSTSRLIYLICECYANPWSFYESVLQFLLTTAITVKKSYWQGKNIYSLNEALKAVRIVKNPKYLERSSRCPPSAHIHYSTLSISSWFFRSVSLRLLSSSSGVLSPQAGLENKKGDDDFEALPYLTQSLIWILLLEIWSGYSQGFWVGLWRFCNNYNRNRNINNNNNKNNNNITNDGKTTILPNSQHH